MNANRISLLIPKPGETEHWTYQNGGGGWDHPIHLHFEEGVTMERNTPIIAQENLVRKDVWRLHPSGSVKFQVRFGEFGGAYVNHCHNTVHEDFAMLLRYQILTDKDNPKSSNVHVDIIPTPIPTPDGCTYMTPDVLAEGNPAGNQVTVSAAPVISSTPILGATVGAVYSYDVNATDANGDTLTYSLDNAPVGMGINGVSGLITWTPTSGQMGANPVTVRVADPKSLFATQSFILTVGFTAVAPVITSTPILAGKVGTAYRYDVDATDANGDSLTYRLVAPIPAGMTINQATGLISWTPSANGAFNVTVRVTDVGGLFAQQSFTVTVAANAAPVIDSRPSTTGKVAVPYNYTVHATDPNGDAITYRGSGLGNPNNLSVDATTGVVSWTPTQAGNIRIRVRASDTAGLTVEQSFFVQVSA